MSLLRRLAGSCYSSFIVISLFVKRGCYSFIPQQRYYHSSSSFTLATSRISTATFPWAPPAKKCRSLLSATKMSDQEKLDATIARRMSDFVGKNIIMNADRHMNINGEIATYGTAVEAKNSDQGKVDNEKIASRGRMSDFVGKNTILDAYKDKGSTDEISRKIMMANDSNNDPSVQAQKPQVQKPAPFPPSLVTNNDNEPPEQAQKAPVQTPPPSPPSKQHTITVCLVPPPSEKSSWNALTKARTELKDPGLYRWPPHANLLYPFLTLRPRKKQQQQQQQKPEQERTSTASDNSEDDSSSSSNDSNDELVGVENGGGGVRKDIVMKLRNATKQVEPFNVTLDTFGTFGGKQRGVLWLYPKSSHRSCHPSSEQALAQQGDENDKDEPLYKLQSTLEHEFPTCTDQRKGASKSFSPHMTLSHYPNLEEAQTAQRQIESWWIPQTFVCHEIYLLERYGDDGQFVRVAALPLGKGGGSKVDDDDDDEEFLVVNGPATSSSDHDNDNHDEKISLGKVVVYDPPLPFPDMPHVEEDWVREERMKMKQRRNRRPGRRKRGPRRGGGPKNNNNDTTNRNDGRRGPSRSKDTPEMIAQKRAERKAKRERLEREQLELMDNNMEANSSSSSSLRGDDGVIKSEEAKGSK